MESGALIWQRAGELIATAIDDAVTLRPLPPPPLLFDDMPVFEPDAEALRQRALGLHAADRAGFERLIAEAVEQRCPDHVKRAIDEERALEKWMSTSADLLASDATRGRLNEWLSAALDPAVPDAERWHIAIALLVGLARTEPAVLAGDGAHIVESIVIAAPPGRWSTRAVRGPESLDWRPGDAVDHAGPESHADGTFAAVWLLDALSDSPAHAETLAEWFEAFAVRPHLHAPLRYIERLIESAAEHPSIGAAAASALPHLMSTAMLQARPLAHILISHDEPAVRRRLLEMTPSILPSDLHLAIELIDAGLEDSDGDVRVLATSALNGLDLWDEQAFMARCPSIAGHPDPRVRRRFGQTGLRSCLAIDPTDECGVLTKMWLDDDETLRARLEVFMMELASTDADAFEMQLERIRVSDPAGLDRLNAAIEASDTDRFEAS